MSADDWPYLVERLRTLLAHDPRTGQLDIHIEVLPDRVWLRGEVPTESRRQAVAEVAAEAIDGVVIQNEVTVTRAPEPSPGEREEIHR